MTDTVKTFIASIKSGQCQSICALLASHYPAADKATFEAISTERGRYNKSAGLDDKAYHDFDSHGKGSIKAKDCGSAAEWYMTLCRWHRMAHKFASFADKAKEGWEAEYTFPVPSEIEDWLKPAPKA